MFLEANQNFLFYIGTDIVSDSNMTCLILTTVYYHKGTYKAYLPSLNQMGIISWFVIKCHPWLRHQPSHITSAFTFCYYRRKSKLWNLWPLWWWGFKTTLRILKIAIFTKTKSLKLNCSTVQCSTHQFCYDLSWKSSHHFFVLYRNKHETRCLSFSHEPNRYTIMKLKLCINK